MNDRHLRILVDVFSHPVPRNLEWREIVSVVNELGSALERHNGKYEFQIGRTKAVFTKPLHKDVDSEEITELRRFLLQAWSDAGPVAPKATVVVIDHQAARIFAARDDGELAERAHIEPHDPHGFLRHLKHRKEADYSGQRVPEADEFYERVAEQLRSDAAIAVIGEATGKSSAMRSLLDYLERNHKEIAGRVVATAARAG